jgi:hypothetical protein
MKNILLVILIGLAGTCTAQKQANIWHFGDGQCIDFSNGAPVSVTGSQIFAAGAPGSYSDKFGNLLFYTNGGGDPFGTETVTLVGSCCLAMIFSMVDFPAPFFPVKPTRSRL